MKQYEAVIKVMEENGGFATLGFLNQNVLSVRNCEWKTKTPFASIRRIVQDERFFFKIRPGLWALKSHREIVLNIFKIEDEKKNSEELDHYYYQGLLVEIGNLKNYETFVPNQDKNKNYLNKPLKELTTISDIYNFTFNKIINRAKTVDVCWFNNRKLPSYMFEVEHSTDIYNSLLKFVELQDFYINFFIVAHSAKEEQFKKKYSMRAFDTIQNRVKFLNYDNLSKWHSTSFEMSAIENGIFRN